MGPSRARGPNKYRGTGRKRVGEVLSDTEILVCNDVMGPKSYSNLFWNFYRCDLGKLLDLPEVPFPKNEDISSCLAVL
jgi:hypothetical protein